MILVRLLGGLGNQMFQYAAGRALAHKLEVPLQLDLRDFRSYRLRGYGLDRMSISASPATAETLADWPIWQREISRLASRIGLPTRWFHERDLRFSAQLGNRTAPVGLDGYFQCEKYFNDARHLLLQEFRPKTPLSSRNAELAEEMRASASVSVHVRRGDYVSNRKTMAVHGLCSQDYYHRAIRVLNDQDGALRFFIFSDDPAWCRENLAIANAVFVEHNIDAPECDIHLMAQCKHHIIANSSFSWWGAWLGDNRGVTIAPVPWFSDSKLLRNEIRAQDWVSLPRD